MDDYKKQVVDCKWINDPKQEETVQLKAKVEELQVQFKGAEERAQLALKYKDKYRLERDELQKRVDSASQQLSGFIRMVDEDLICDESLARLIISNLKGLEQALKGE